MPRVAADVMHKQRMGTERYTAAGEVAPTSNKLRARGQRLFVKSTATRKWLRAREAKQKEIYKSPTT